MMQQLVHYHVTVQAVDKVTIVSLENVLEDSGQLLP